MSIIGESLQPYVINQINARQRLHGSGAGTANKDTPNLRSDQQINLLNSNTSWIKLASGVSVSSGRLADVGVDSSYHGMELAKKYILFAGFSKLEEDGSDRLVQRQGFLPQDPNSSYTYGTYGYSPMPGITDADIKSLNRGSLKKATVRLKVHNKQQFDIIDLLYLRLGYTVLLEWGNSIYTPNGVTREIVRNTILEDPYRFFNSGYSKGKSYLDILPVIEYYRRQYEGNYDGLLGKVSNFSWSFQPDGSYDIELTIISLGDVVESLKTNISSNKQLSQFISDALSSSPPQSENEEGGENNIIEENADSNDIAAMLFTWKFTNRDKLQYESNEDSIFIERPDDAEPRFMGAFLEPNATATLTQIPIEFFVVDEAGTKIYPNLSQDPYYKSNFGVQYFDPIATPDIEKEAERVKREKYYKMVDDKKNETTDFSTNEFGAAYGKFLDVEYKIKTSKKSSITSPLIGFSKKDACFINTEPDKQFYLKFGALLNYIENNILPKISTKDPSNYNEKPPIFNINNDTYGTGTTGNYMYSLPNQISLDPRVCIVRNDNLQTASGVTKVYTNLSPFKADDYVKNNPNPNKAYIMNVYLNFEFIINCINDNSDERGDIGVFGFLKAICDGLNKSLGGINNLEPVINETNNTLSILDTTPIPGLNKKGSDYILQLYGYGKTSNGYISNFVRKVDLKTAITPEYATMITVGATAGGYVKGTEGTAFSKWNVGLTDRFQEKFIPGNEDSNEENGEDEAAVNYTNKFLSAKAGSASRYGFKGNIISDNAKNLQIDPGAIEKNVSVVTEYYKYLIASQNNKSGGTIGFIPFKISFTMDGISGIKIYNKLQVDTRFLPKAYGDNLDLIVTGVSHKLSNSDWETDIEATVIPKTEGTSAVFITSTAIKEDVQAVKSTGKQTVPVLKVEDLKPWTRKIPRITQGDTWEAEATNFIALKESLTTKVTKLDQGTYRGGYGSDKKLVNGKLETVILGTTFTKQEAADTLRTYSVYFYSDTIIKAIGKSNWDKLNNHQKAALLSLSYNAGKFIWSGGYRYANKIISAIKKGDYREAAQGILDGPKTGKVDGYIPSLARRRTEEAQLFLYPASKSIY